MVPEYDTTPAVGEHSICAFSPGKVSRLAVSSSEVLCNGMPAGSEVMQLWRNIGLLDGELRPKPAWEIWQRCSNAAM